MPSQAQTQPDHSDAVPSLALHSNAMPCQAKHCAAKHSQESDRIKAQLCSAKPCNAKRSQVLHCTAKPSTVSIGSQRSTPMRCNAWQCVAERS